jgi:hypothetical protein
LVRRARIDRIAPRDEIRRGEKGHQLGGQAVKMTFLKYNLQESRREMAGHIWPDVSLTTEKNTCQFALPSWPFELLTGAQTDDIYFKNNIN